MTGMTPRPIGRALFSTSAATVAAWMLERRTDMTTETNSPAFMLYRVDGNGPEARWTKIGAAWPNRDGKGFNILCDAVPLQGRIVMRA